MLIGILNNGLACNVSYINANGVLARNDENSLSAEFYVTNTKGDVVKFSDHSGAYSGIDYRYDAYGVQETEDEGQKRQVKRQASENTIPVQLGYARQRQDSYTALLHVNACFYNPRLKQFISFDSYDLLNRFNYGNANPIVNVDPSGHILIGLINTLGSAPANLINTLLEHIPGLILNLKQWKKLSWIFRAS